MAIFYGLQLAGQNVVHLKPRPTLDTVREIGTTSDGLDIAVPNFTLEAPKEESEQKALPA